MCVRRTKSEHPVDPLYPEPVATETSDQLYIKENAVKQSFVFTESSVFKYNMDYRLTILVCIVLFALVSASPAREKRDIMESMKGAWNDMVKTLSDAGDAVVHVFKPTEKSVLNKMADGIKELAD